MLDNRTALASNPLCNIDRHRMKKRTNSVISSMYHYPISKSKIKTAVCMFVGGLILVCLGVGLIVTTLSIEHPSSINSHVDETSVLISGPTCLGLGIVVLILSGTDMFRYRKARNAIESELNRVISSVSKSSPSSTGQQNSNQVSPISNNNISIVINKTLWPS